MQYISVIPQVKKSGIIIIRGYYRRRPVASRSTGHKIAPADWDSKNRQVLSSRPNAKLINLAISKELQQIESELLKTELSGTEITPQVLTRIVSKAKGALDFLVFVRGRIRTDYSNEFTSGSYLMECSKISKFREQIRFSDINHDFLSDYKKWMKKKGNDDNTVWKTFKFMNTFMNKAIRSGIIQESPFKSFDRGRYKQKVKTGLEISDCEKIYDLVKKGLPSVSREVAIRFLLMAYSGMRFADAVRFDPALHIKSGRLIMVYQKFNTDVNIKMHERLTQIIELISGPMEIKYNQFNELIKSVGLMAGIEKKVTSHLGRHSMGGFLRDAGVPVYDAQKILGHRNWKSTMIYYHDKQDTIDQQVDKLNQLKAV